FNVTTQSQRNYLLEHQIEPERIVVLPNFSPLPAVAEIGRTHSHTDGALVFVALGRLVEKKGFDLLIDAFAQLVQVYPAVRLKIAGRGPQLAKLQAQAAVLGVDEKIEFSGWVTDIAGFLDQGDVFVLPSRDEPFGIVVLEAMARGLAIVSTKTQGPLEILSEDMAWLVDCDDRDALKQALFEAYSDDRSRADKAQRALMRFKAHYAEDQVVPKLYENYKKLIKAKE
ncbi:MAG TPA: glycosyltransferase, partial [Halothiobacillaceae bacterium]|nr:glycosyltransferase [Halothiobacillaceae bacterium]